MAFRWSWGGGPHLTGSVTLPGLNGGASSIWDFVSGSFSPSPSPVFSSLPSTSSSGDLARLLRDLDEAKKKLKQWEEAWLQVKQVSAFSKPLPALVFEQQRYGLVLVVGV